MAYKTRADLLLELERTRVLLKHATTARDGTTVRNPNHFVQLMYDLVSLEDLEQEHFWTVPLNSRQKVLDVHVAAIGSLAQVSVNPRDVFRNAVRVNAHALLIAHNHPSMNPEASAADIELTKRMYEAGQLLGIPVLDHIIMCANGDYTSLASLGLMPS